MTLFTKLNDKKRMLRSTGKSKVFSLLTMSGNKLELFVISYQCIKSLSIYFPTSTIDNLYSLQTLHSKPFPRHLYPFFLPAIKVLHSAWTKHATKNKYRSFRAAINAATVKLEEYYTKTATSNAHIIAMGTSQHFVICSQDIFQSNYSITSQQENVSL